MIFFSSSNSSGLLSKLKSVAVLSIFDSVGVLQLSSNRGEATAPVASSFSDFLRSIIVHFF